MHATPLFYVIVIVGIGCETTPLAVLAVRRRKPRGARAWVAAWVGYGLAIDLISSAFALRGEPNLWIGYFLMPVSVSLALWALSLWQTSDVWRLTFRIAIVPLLVAWGILTLVVEDTSTFSKAAEPMVKLVTLGAAAFSLLAGSLSRRGDLLRQDWFWFSSGLVLYFGCGATLGPISSLINARAPEMMPLVYSVWTLMGSAAFLLIAKGMACPAPAR